MTFLREGFDARSRMPSWVASGRAETAEEAAFLSGAALSQLHLHLNSSEVPRPLLIERLALTAAEASLAVSGRQERAKELRDALAFLQPGDRPGPPGEVYRSWRRAVSRPLSVNALQRALPHVTDDRITAWLDAGQGPPVARAAGVLQAVLLARPKDHVSGLILADAAMAQALGWSHIFPLLATGLKRQDLTLDGELLRLACHKAIARSGIDATRMAADLTRRAARLRSVLPKLRAKGAKEAVSLLLTRDAVPPAALTSLRSARAARRFCDRLVDLGVVRELTGRDTFRIYGI